VPTSPADIRNAALLSVATVAAGFIVPVFPYAGLPLAAFALGWLTYRFGPMPAAGLAVVTAGLVAVVGPPVLGIVPLDGLFVAVSLLALGPVGATALRRYPALNVAVGAALAITLAFLVAPIGAETLKESLIVWKQLLGTLAVNGSTSDPAAVQATTAAVLVQMSTTWPATCFYTMGIGAAIGVSLLARAGRSLGQDVHRYALLADTDVSFHVLWPTIAGLALVAAGSLWAQAPALLQTIGANALMIVRPLLFLQGAALFAALYRKAGAGRVNRTIGLVLLMLTETIVPSVSVLGVVDLFANLRKLPRAGFTTPGVPM
jgi:hypothetical protein